MTEAKPTKPKIVVPNEPPSDVATEEQEQPREGGDGSRQLVVPETPAVMAIRNTVVFPGAVMPLTVGRAKSARLVEAVLPEEKVIALATQRDESVEEPGPEDLYDVGTAAVVLKMLRSEEGNQTLIVHGLARIRLGEFTQTEPYFRAQVTAMADQVESGKEVDARLLDVREKAEQVVELSQSIPDEAAQVIRQIDEPGPLSDFLAANMPLDLPVRVELLGEPRVLKRLERLQHLLHEQVSILKLSGEIQNEVKASISKDQREYFLREQLKAIRKELGQEDEQTAEIRELEEKVDQAGMSEETAAECKRQLRRLERIPTASPEYNVIRTYVEIMAELPWQKATEDNLDINRAREVLDEDHYDLDKVKRRILEYLAVRKLAPETRGPILCFVGPPGVGKTSLGQSIARALGRKFIRMSLGGLHDEAELRGHRRTYIGAMPGRIVQEIRKAGTKNPVFMLDELDKVGADFRGDPSSALLEILDPAQNHSFQDNYLNVPFDLSQVLFIGTANVMGTVPPALRDRLEVLELPGYTLDEKLHIATKYLVPRQLEQNGLKASKVRFRKAALKEICLYYTREAGVRDLEREIGAVCRAIAAKVAAGEIKSATVTPEVVAEHLGARKHQGEVALRTSTPGVATGLAWTPAGGDIIFVEATRYPGKGELILTGQIGDVMRESARAALSLVRGRHQTYGIDPAEFGKHDIHVHVPAGAVPKDGPSAGVAIVTALLSMFRQRAVRSDVAMTGEITLRGLVLPVGGIKEKALGALQAGIKTVILPERNRRNLEDIPETARKKIEFIFVEDVDQVFEAAIQPERGGKGASGGTKKRSSSKKKSSRKKSSGKKTSKKAAAGTAS
jgi:ATP-dependent Lon protease